MSDAEPPTYAERVRLFALLPDAFSTEDFFDAGRSLGFGPFKVFSCLRHYQFDERVVQQGDHYVKNRDESVM